MRNITQTNKYDTDLGHKLENVVYLELLRRGEKVFVGKNNDKEVDFIVQKTNNEREYYQVAYTVNDERTFERKFSSFKSIRDNYPKYLLTLDYDNVVIEGIQKKNNIDWLLEKYGKVQCKTSEKQLTLHSPRRPSNETAPIPIVGTG